MVEVYSRPSDFIPSQLAEAVKSHSVYDISNRLSEFYVAMTDAAHGTSCLKTTYTYDGATSRIVGTKEQLSTWNSAWDI